jgi:hypothetical protein
MRAVSPGFSVFSAGTPKKGIVATSIRRRIPRRRRNVRILCDRIHRATRNRKESCGTCNAGDTGDTAPLSVPPSAL